MDKQVIRGGKREGAGRKPLGPTPLIQTTVRLPQEALDKLKAAGDGNISAGIRKALELLSPSK